MAGLQKILLVEDTEQIIDIYSRILEMNGYQFKVARTINELLEIAPEFKPDLIFLDIMLPGDKTGLDALPILRNNEQYGVTKTRIVLLTNLGQSDEVQKMFDAYADGYVIKAEIDPHEIIDIIRSFETGNDSDSGPVSSQP